MSAEVFLNGRVQLCCGDNRHFLRDQPSDRYDAIVTDPPYALNFMGKKWDNGDIAHTIDFWVECLRVLKPGGHVVAFSGTRTYHRLVCAIEDAGFEIRDMLSWLYGSGFPKSHDVSKGITLSAKRWQGWGTALKPANEPIVLARKPLSEGTVAANVQKWGTGAINIDGCRVDTADDLNGGRYSDNKQGDDGNTYGSGINLRSALDYAQPSGRWPANVIHDGSDEVVAAFPDAPGQQGLVSGNEPTANGFSGAVSFSGMRARVGSAEPRGDSGSAARFFYHAKPDTRFWYTSKAGADDRLGSAHPTVKPVDLMQWLCRLVTPKGGLVLDPFAGTGTTGEACFRESLRCMLVESEPEYQADIRRRMALCMSGPNERLHVSIKAKMNGKPIDAGPLFNVPSPLNPALDGAATIESREE